MVTDISGTKLEQLANQRIANMEKGAGVTLEELRKKHGGPETVDEKKQEVVVEDL